MDGISEKWKPGKKTEHGIYQGKAEAGTSQEKPGDKEKADSEYRMIEQKEDAQDKAWKICQFTVSGKQDPD